MEQKTLSKQEILDEIKKVLDFYNDDIINISYTISFTFKDYDIATITKNYHIPFSCSIGKGGIC